MKEKGRKGILGKEPIYEESFKIALAREYLSGQLSLGQLAKKYQIESADTVRYFVNWYKRWLSKQEELHGVVPSGKSDTILSMEQQLQHANLRIAALEMLIQNAEKELGIDLIKKPGTKQLAK